MITTKTKMIDIIYNYTLLAAAVTEGAYGVLLLRQKVPNQLLYKPYKRASRMFALAMFITSANIILSFAFQLRSKFPDFIGAIDLLFYYSITILMVGALLTLLDTAFSWRKGIYLNFMLLAAIGTALIPINLYSEPIVKHLCNASFSLFLLTFLIFSLKKIWLAYKNAMHNMDEYYSDNKHEVVKWMKNGIITYCSFGVFSPIVALSTKEVNIIYCIIGICVYTYFISSFLNYLVYFMILRSSQEETPTINTNITMDSDKFEELKNRIDLWINEKKFCTVGVTIENLAADCRSNRNYVSQFINTNYHCTFREMINTLRIEEAKQILSNNKEMTIDQVSMRVGFSYSSYFIRQFVKLTGTTPTKWRESN